MYVYAEDDEELAQRRGEMRWVPRLQGALEENQLELAFQYSVPVSEPDEQHHYELVLRLRDERAARLVPGAFRPAAERLSLGPRLERRVVDAALSWLASHSSHLPRLHLCSVNLSGQSLGDDNFLEFLMRKFNTTGIATEKICLVLEGQSRELEDDQVERAYLGYGWSAEFSPPVASLPGRLGLESAREPAMELMGRGVQGG